MKRQFFRPRTIIQFGLFITIVMTAAFLINHKQDFASIAYPPIPDSHFQYINDAVKHCGVPFSKRGLIAAIAWKESTFHADSQSGAGAIGVMQVLRGTGLGTANEYQIGGLNAATFTDPAIGYKLGTCYFHSIVTRLGDAKPEAWDNDQIIRASLVAYNAGPGRGQALLDGAYNGPSSSLGYAQRIMEGAKVYSLDFARYDQQVGTKATDVLQQGLRDAIWQLFLKQDSKPQ